MENENIQIQAPAKKKSKKKWIIIAIVAVLFIAIAGSGSDEPTVETTSNNDSVSQSDTKNDETKPSTDSIKVGSVVSDSNLKITYKSCNIDFKNYSKYADVKSGYKIIQAVFDFENISSSDIILEGFDCYADGAKCESFYFVDDYSNPILTSVSAGRKLTDATVYYEVPADAEKIELEYHPDMWNNEKYIFIAE